MARAFDVLGFGALAVDDILYVDRPLCAGKGKVTKRVCDHGGNVATALVAVARLGGRAAFIGWLGNPPEDVGGRELERQGVSTGFAPRHADAAPIRSVITVGPDGERFIAYDDDVLHGTSPDLPDAVLAQAPVLLIDGYAVHSEAAVARARRSGLSIVADIEWTIGSASDRILSLADHLVLPIAFARSCLKEDDPQVLLEALWSPDRSAVVLTDGERGSYLRQRGDPVFWHVPAYRVQAVDTTGAGDCFHGAYALALAEGGSPLDCVIFAATAAAISVTSHGGRRGLPDRAMCLSWMAGEHAPVPVPLQA